MIDYLAMVPTWADDPTKDDPVWQDAKDAYHYYRSGLASSGLLGTFVNWYALPMGERYAWRNCAALLKRDTQAALGAEIKRLLDKYEEQ